MINGKKNAGFVPSECNNWEYPYQPGTLIKVLVRGGNGYMGYLSKESTQDQMFLKPSLSNEPFFTGGGVELINYILEDKIPAVIERDAVIGTSPISEDFLKRLLDINKHHDNKPEECTDYKSQQSQLTQFPQIKKHSYEGFSGKVLGNKKTPRKITPWKPKELRTKREK